jgi:hypothetical protein
MMLLRYFGVLFAALTLLAPAVALADPPDRVGRLAYLEDRVWFATGRDEALQPATANWPISSGAVVHTGERGRAEIWIDSTALRLADNTQVDFARVDDQQVALNLAAGRLAVSFMEAEQAADLVLRLPGADLRFLAAGRYRLEVEGGRSELTTLAGLASIEHAGGRLQVAAGNKAVLFADGSLRVASADRADAFDHWVSERENLTMASQARRHVSPYMTGYQDLDAYGDWDAHGEYGSVWYPRAIAADWAPYRFGRWAWVAPWGWTWIDAAPWGFAPFHYGRWLQIHGRWAWIPGRRAERPVYAPALVAWIGNPGWSVSFSFGAAPAVGWFPLAPREVYVPHYRYSPTYIRRLNVTHVYNVNVIERAARGERHERFAHRDSPQAVTVVPANQLREGRSITRQEFRRVERHDLGRAPVAAVSPAKEWLAPAPEARRPRTEDRSRHEAVASRPERRAEPDSRQPPPAAREAAPSRRPVQAERVVQPERAPAGAVPSVVREPVRDQRQDSRPVRAPVAPEVRSPAVLPQPMPERAQPPVQREPRREQGDDHRGRREVPEGDAAPQFRRQEAAPRSLPQAAPAPAPMREMRVEARPPVVRPEGPRQEETRSVRRPEAETRQPANRPPETKLEAPRERQSSERRGRGEEGDERGRR